MIITNKQTIAFKLPDEWDVAMSFRDANKDEYKCIETSSYIFFERTVTVISENAYDGE